MSLMELWGKISTIWYRAKKAQAECQKSILRQAWEILSLYYGPGLLSPSEYYDFGLFNDTRFPAPAKSTFLGYRFQRQYDKLNNNSWHAAANDKLLFAALMQAMRLPTPRILGVFHSKGRYISGASSLKNSADLKRFFSQLQEYPVFVKPVHGYYGKGTFLIHGYDDSDQTLFCHNGKLPVETLMKELRPFGDAGWLIQKQLQPSPAIQAICGNRLPTVRLIVFQDSSGPQLFRANWKIPVGENIVSNTEGWRNGNIAAAVDHRTGKVEGVFQGKEMEVHAIDRHPDTKAPLSKIEIPDWEQMKAYVLKASPGFPGLRFLGWDLASTSEGVMALEVNLVTNTTVMNTQFLSGQGFLDDSLTEVLKRA